MASDTIVRSGHTAVVVDEGDRQGGPKWTLQLGLKGKIQWGPWKVSLVAEKKIREDHA